MKKKTTIIGAGICGLYLAWKLAEKGEKVIVFEKKEKIGKEVCSGLFSERILEFIPQSQKLIQNKIEFALIHFSKRTLKINFSRKFLVMSHAKLDKMVAKLAENKGAEIVLERQIDSLPQGSERIIGCDGPFSMVRKSLGLAAPNYRLAIQGFVLEQNYSNFVETWPVNQGFIWKIPRGEETEYGIIARSGEANNLFKDFLKENRISLRGTVAAAVPHGFATPKDSRNVTICGDAAGLTKPWSGGGVVWGLMAADILLRNYPDFIEYHKEVKRFFLPKILFSRAMIKIFYATVFNFSWLLPKKIRIEGDFLL